jgi:hypothetical protein
VRLTDPVEVDDIERLFDFGLDPQTSSWILASDGVWTRRLFDADGNRLRDYQESLIDIKLKRGFAP